MFGRTHLLVLGLVLCACGDKSGPTTQAVLPSVLPSATSNPCQAGFAPNADGMCIEIAAESCGPGTMPEIGHEHCQPVGWTDACPAGMKRDGWGCLDTVPASCPVGARQDIASGECVGIGDCHAPFPPPEATLFVAPDATVDATHFKTITAAVSAAPAGATIAVEAGTYKEILEISQRPVNVVGRCAAKVIITSPGGPRAGLFLHDTRDVTVRAITVTGFPGGILAEGGEMVIEDSVFRDNVAVGAFLKLGAHVTLRRSKLSNTVASTTGEVGGGIVVYGGSTLLIEDSAVTDNYFRNATVSDADSTLDATNVFFARNTPLSASEPAASVAVSKGATLKLTRSIVTDSALLGVSAVDRGTNAQIAESIVRRAQGKVKDGGGIAVYASGDAVVKIDSSAVAEQPVVGVYADGKARVTITKSTFVWSAPQLKAEVGRGLQAVGGAMLDVRDTAFIGLPQSGIGLQKGGLGTFDRVYVREARPIRKSIGLFGGFGLLAEGSSKATITRSAFEGNALSGISVNQSSEVTAEAVLVRDTKEVPVAGVGSGTQVARQGVFTVTRSAFIRNTGTTAILATGGVLRVTDSSLRATALNAGSTFGHAVSIFDARLELLRTSVTDSAGVGVIAAGGQAVIRESLFVKNTVALHAQDGSTIVESDAPADDLAAGEVRVSTDTKFIDNGSRIGSGAVAVPKPMQ